MSGEEEKEGGGEKPRRRFRRQEAQVGLGASEAAVRPGKEPDRRVPSERRPLQRLHPVRVHLGDVCKRERRGDGDAAGGDRAEEQLR